MLAHGDKEALQRLLQRGAVRCQRRRYFSVDIRNRPVRGLAHKRAEHGRVWLRCRLCQLWVLLVQLLIQGAGHPVVALLRVQPVGPKHRATQQLGFQRERIQDARTPQAGGRHHRKRPAAPLLGSLEALAKTRHEFVPTHQRGGDEVRLGGGQVLAGGQPRDRRQPLQDLRCAIGTLTRR